MSTKFDKEAIESLIARIEQGSKKRTAKSEISLSLKENNIIKAINPDYSYDLIGEWNGYGYTKLGKHLQVANYKEVLKNLKKMVETSEIKKEKKEKTPDEKIQKWAERLVKFTGITIDEALNIAREKIDYKIEKLEQSANYDYQGNKLPAWLKKAERDLDRINDDESKALDRVEDEGHARAILIARRRHLESNYEEMLDEAKILKISGEIEKNEVQDYARRAMQY